MHVHGVRSCSKCKRRRGRSAFRRSSRQRNSQINALYEIYNLNTGHPKKLAEQKLRRLGFHPDRWCALPAVCNFLLVRTPGHKEELFPGVNFRDKLHGLLTFLHRTLYQGFARMGLPGKLKQTLDQRLTELGLERIMRDPNTGRTYRVLKSLFKDVGMTGEDKTHWIFLVPHVLGHRALCLPAELREPVLQAFTTAQSMIVASRGRRSYNTVELDHIFNRGFVIFFSAMERIYQINHDRIYKTQIKKHRKNPKKNKAPKRFVRKDT